MPTSASSCYWCVLMVFSHVIWDFPASSRPVIFGCIPDILKAVWWVLVLFRNPIERFMFLFRRHSPWAGSGWELWPAFHELWYQCVFSFQDLCSAIHIVPITASLGIQPWFICWVSSQSLWYTVEDDIYTCAAWGWTQRFRSNAMVSFSHGPPSPWSP